MRTARLLSLISGVGALAVLGLPMALAPRDALAQQVVTVQLRAQNNSGQNGTAVLTGQGNRTLVVHPDHWWSGRGSASALSSWHV
ncbi:MAG: hypothetical protein KatS3mg060_2755 [Dehalococcoidia bacterium]|nr:MAG: hypothetical protein KatS3mg060_2755 [Dehalococcoidia bacterium]